MTGPNPQALGKQLGQSYDYVGLQRAFETGAIDKLPDDMQEAAKNLLISKIEEQRKELGLPPLEKPRSPMSVIAQGMGMMMRGLSGLVPNPAIQVGGQALGGAIDPTTTAAQSLQQMGQQREQAQPFASPLSVPLLQEFGYQFSMGLIPAPTMENAQAEAAWNLYVKPSMAVGAMVAQGGLSIRAIGYMTKLPRAMAILEQMPVRMSEVGINTIAGGLQLSRRATMMSHMVGGGMVEGLRPEGIPEEPGALDPVGLLAGKMHDVGVPERAALAASGVGFGAALSGIVGGMARGWQAGRQAAYLSQLTPEMTESMKKAIQSTGVVTDTMTPKEIVKVFTGIKKSVLDENLAGMVGDRLSREEYIINEAFDSANLAQSSEEGRLLAGMFRTNTGGISIVTDIKNVGAVEEASKRLGIRLQYMKIRQGEVLEDVTDAAGVVTQKKTPVYDLIVTRPNFQYGSATEVSKKAKHIARVMAEASKNNADKLDAVVSKEMWLLPDGTPIRGNFKMHQIEGRLRLQKPELEGVGRPDLALRIQGQAIRMELGAGNKMTIELPGKLTSDQFDNLGRMFDAKKFEELTIVGVKGDQVVLKTPLGAQVQDAVAGIVKPVKTVSRLTPAMAHQYKATGVFDGQAAVLADGTPARIVRRMGFLYEVKDPLTGDLVKVHRSKLTALPTTLEGEMAPSNLFLQYLDDEEKVALVRLRRSLTQGLGQEIKTLAEVESFANTRGFVANRLKGGKVELVHANSGESVTFDSKKAAIEFIRKSTPPMADITPGDMTKYLGGDLNMGMIGGGGPPPRFGEVLPLDWDRIMKSIETMSTDRGPGAWEQFRKPTFALFQALDQRLGTSTVPIFLRLQSQSVASINWQQMILTGRVAGLPSDLMPIKAIEKLAGRNADWERVHHWLEVAKGGPEEAGLLAAMSNGEKKAGVEIRKLLNWLYKEVGVEADFLENYMPHWRQLAPTHGNQPLEIWRATGGDPLRPPKGAQFFADQFREGTIDIYDQHALRVVNSYVRAAATNRFMKEAFDDAAKVIAMMATKNEAATMPLAHMVQAMRGREFFEQRAALNETFRSILEKLPGKTEPGTVADIADRWVNTALGSVYTSAMGARPGTALRNASSAITMVWPLVGGKKGDFLEAMGRALSYAGKQEAIADRAIAIKGGTHFAPDRVEVLESLPGKMQQFVDASMGLYDSADAFTRATAYWAGRLNTEKALARFAQRAVKATPETVAKLQREVIRDSGLYVQDKQVIDEFWRRAAHNPEDAARFSGKVTSDVVNFLYGRGMQQRWMRSTGGRFFGQFGTWAFNYADHLMRLLGRAAKGEYKAEAMRALGRHAIINAAIVYTGKEILDIDLSRWANYGSIFYSGGPGWELAHGATTLQRGIGEVASFNEDPLAQARVTRGAGVIGNTLRSFVPFYGVGKDINNFLTADREGGLIGTGGLAALMQTRPTRSYTLEQKIAAMFGKDGRSFVGGSEALEDLLDDLVRGGGNTVPIEQGLQEMQGTIQGAPQMPAMPPSVPAQSARPQPPVPLQTLQPKTPPGAVYNPGNEVSKSAEAPPPQIF